MSNKTMVTLIGITMMTGGLFAQAPLAGQAANSTTSQAQPARKAAPAQVAPDKGKPQVKTEVSNKDGVVIGVIQQLKLVGNAAFIEAESVEALLAKELCDGKTKTIGDLKEAIAKARSVLIDRGYYMVQIQPVSKDAYHADAKTLGLLVEPGRMGDVKVTLKDETSEGDGHVWFSKEQIEKRFKYVQKDAPFNYLSLRRALAGVNGHPDMTADTKISVRAAKAGEQADTALTKWADVDLEVEDSFPFHATLAIDNYAMDELDDWEASLCLQYLNLTGADDVLTITPSMTFNADMFAISGGYSRPFDLFLGGNFNIYGGWSDMEVDDITPRLDLEGTGWFAGAGLSFNLWDTDVRNVAFNLGIMYRYIEDEFNVLGTTLQNRDVGVLPLTLGFSYGDKKRDWLGGMDFASISLTQNLCDSGDDFKKYSESAEENYMIFRGSWSRLQPLIGSEIDGEEWRCWSLFTKIEGQYSSDELITAERLAYGGNACLRGYRKRGYLGDYGVYGSAEFRTPVWCNFFSDLFGAEANSAIDRFQFFAFTDAGWISFNDATPGMEEDEFLWSAGIGARMALTQYCSFNVDLAFPLTSGYADAEDEDCEVYMSLKFQW